MNEWVIIAIIAVVLLFSAKKLPDMARGLGQSMRIFKSETRGMREDEQAADKSTSHSTAARPPGEIAPGRSAGSPNTASNGSVPAEPDTAGNAGATDGAPRAGS